MDLDAIEARANNATEGPWELPERDELGWYAPHQPDTFDDYVFTSRARADVPDLVARVRALEDENQRMREYLSHAVKFSFGTDMASHAEVTRAEQNRPDGNWFFRSWGPTERHATQEAALEAALSRAREIAEEEA